MFCPNRHTKTGLDSAQPPTPCSRYAASSANILQDISRYLPDFCWTMNRSVQNSDRLNGGIVITAEDPIPVSTEKSILIRQAKAVDAEACGRICLEALSSLAAQHGFAADCPAPEIPIGALSWMFSVPAFFCVVAERDGKLIGSNCLDERSPIAGIGPGMIDPAAQNQSVGRKLMQAIMTRASERNFPGIRLVQGTDQRNSGKF